MLTTIKTYMDELPELTFGEFYQNYICAVQDMNVQAEVKGINTDEILSLNSILNKLNNAMGHG